MCSSVCQKNVHTVLPFPPHMSNELPSGDSLVYLALNIHTLNINKEWYIIILQTKWVLTGYLWAPGLQTCVWIFIIIRHKVIDYIQSNFCKHPVHQFHKQALYKQDLVIKIS